ncbi:MAG: MerR family transcriptional regulator [Planctomycetes bacterium]|nr:MerR family transcriptional regulator [Planctomycetota bacterium]
MSAPPSRRRLLRIGEVARRFRVTPQLVRHYCILGLVRETSRSPAGYRLFDDRAVECIDLIRRLNRSGYSLGAIKETFLRGRTANAGG